MNTDISGTFVRIDPREFINPPFSVCPICRRSEFGILFIYKDGFSRKCKTCGHKQHDCLPAIRKTLIYLDQFAISNLLFADKPNLKKTVDPFWPRLLNKLNELLCLQLVVCPVSSAHGRESVLSNHRVPLKKMLDSLSLDISFKPFETIRRFQFIKHLQMWLRSQPYDELIPEVEIRRMLWRDPHVWTDRLTITLNIGPIPSYIEEVKAERELTHEALVGIFQRWKENPDVRWEQWFEQEALSYGPKLLETYFRDQSKFSEVWEGHRLPEGGSLPLPTQYQLIVSDLLREIKRIGIVGEKAWQTLQEYLHSPNLKNLPFNRISAALYASLAKRAAHQKKPPTKGFFTDVDVISCLAPYCDAMFLDVECWSYLSELKKSSRLKLEARVFSQRNKEEFIEYLDGLKASASPEHMRRVREIYGP